MLKDIFKLLLAVVVVAVAVGIFCVVVKLTVHVLSFLISLVVFVSLLWLVYQLILKNDKD